MEQQVYQLVYQMKKELISNIQIIKLFFSNFVYRFLLLAKLNFHQKLQKINKQKFCCYVLVYSLFSFKEIFLLPEDVKLTLKSRL